jgi:hypothetical protein
MNIFGVEGYRYRFEVNSHIGCNALVEVLGEF